MPSDLKLGKLPHRHDPRSLQLVRYLDAAKLKPAPAAYTLPQQPTWPMFLNDQLGDCTCAAAAHMLEAWSSAAGHEVTITDQDVLAAYEAVAGYDPTTGANDNGAVELDVLRYWRTTGIAANQLGAFAQVDPHVPALVRDAVFLFGGLYIGVALPVSASDQLDAGQPWHVTGSLTGRNAPGSWGGHAIPIVAYDRYGLTCVTWGALQKMTWSWFRAYVDEAWALLDADWMSGGKSVTGFDLATLQADLAQVGKVAA